MKPLAHTAHYRHSRRGNVRVCSIDALGPSNFDGVWLEGEHGPLDYADIGNLGRACDLWGMTSLARVKKAMDQVDENTINRHPIPGVQGIIVPHINTRAEAEMVVAASKFKNDEFPMGRRGMFLSRQGFGVPDYYMKANHETMAVILIEDIVAVNNLPDILKVDHIDVFHVAFADLAQCVESLRFSPMRRINLLLLLRLIRSSMSIVACWRCVIRSMGYLHDLGNPKVKEVTERAIKQIVSSGRTCGTSPLSLEEAQRHHALGGEHACHVNCRGRTDPPRSCKLISMLLSAPFICENFETTVMHIVLRHSTIFLHPARPHGEAGDDRLLRCGRSYACKTGRLQIVSGVLVVNQEAEVMLGRMQKATHACLEESKRPQMQKILCSKSMYFQSGFMQLREKVCSVVVPITTHHTCIISRLSMIVGYMYKAYGIRRVEQ